MVTNGVMSVNLVGIRCIINALINHGESNVVVFVLFRDFGLTIILHHNIM